MGRPGRLRDGERFKSYVGLALLRSAFVRAADMARKQDPPLANIYYPQMTERGTPCTASELGTGAVTCGLAG
jgi:hypothetical protein